MSDSKIPSAASSWTRATLEALNASFDRHMVTQFVFDRDRLAIPTDLQQQVDALADAFSNVNNSDRITPQFYFNASSHPLLIRFEYFYRQLGLILTRDSPPNQSSREQSQNTTSRTQVVLPSTAAPSTPPPSTNRINPQYSSGSSATASSRAKEKDEHYTQSMANVFVYASYESLRTWLEPFTWDQEMNYRLQHSAHQKMHVRLQGNKVIAESDGGLSFQPDPARPLLIRQSKRKKHAQINKEDTYQMHAAQIYAEMLGQVCHRDLYRNPGTFQEVFVLHARHATFYLYYAKFPNTYLRDIALYGSEYRQRVRNPEQITIHQSCPFRMRFPKQQANFFRLFANVLFYLVSGNSHVFYLTKDETNPYYQNLMGTNKPRMDQCIQVKQSWEDDSILEEEGPLDDAPDFFERKPALGRTASDSTNSAAWSTRAGPGSPMDDIEDR